MKKIIFIIVFFIAFMTNINALERFHFAERVPNMYSEERSNGKVYSGAIYMIRRSDGVPVYCINPFELLDENKYYKEYYVNDPRFNLTDEQIDRINLIGYYGYNYYNHTDIKWYGITQFMIWKTLGLDDIFFKNYNGDRIEQYKDEIEEIEYLISRHYTLPSFKGNHYEYSSNRTYSIVDTNNILSNYEISYTELDAEIVNNELKINTPEDGLYEIKFIRKSPIDRDYILYGLDSAQAVIYPGRVKDITFNITVEVNSGSVTLNKFDSEGNNYADATLEGAVYGIYDDFKLITTITTDKDGKAYIKDLPLGEYYIKEITPSKGYSLDTNTYYVKITKENKNFIINSYENVIKGDIQINKYYGEDNNYTLEDGAIFELYDSNNNLVKTYETKDGLIEDRLVYGNYYLIQIKGMKGYKFINKLNVSILNDEVYIFDLYNEKEVVEVPDTGKNNYKSHKKSSMSLILFGLILISISKKKKTTLNQ